jgi:hypothetical protein
MIDPTTPEETAKKWQELIEKLRLIRNTRLIQR